MAQRLRHCIPQRSRDEPSTAERQRKQMKAMTSRLFTTLKGIDRSGSLPRPTFRSPRRRRSLIRGGMQRGHGLQLNTAEISILLFTLINRSGPGREKPMIQVCERK
ncbi:hypothetical protein J6590_022659 [Homalodisca vitripennis]|nr:hypothetical protein J6590_022659 [Homalodisca vitripennis]